MTDKPNAKRTLAVVGAIIGMLALGAAFMSPWIASAIDPPPKPAEEVLVDMASKLKAAAEAKMSGETYQASTPDKLPSAYLPPIVIGAGMLAAAFGVGSIMSGEPKVYGACAFGLGVSAAIVQWSIIIATLAIAAIIIGAILVAFGVDL